MCSVVAVVGSSRYCGCCMYNRHSSHYRHLCMQTKKEKKRKREKERKKPKKWRTSAREKWIKDNQEILFLISDLSSSPFSLSSLSSSSLSLLSSLFSPSFPHLCSCSVRVDWSFPHNCHDNNHCNCYWYCCYCCHSRCCVWYVSVRGKADRERCRWGRVSQIRVCALCVRACGGIRRGAGKSRKGEWTRGEEKWDGVKGEQMKSRESRGKDCTYLCLGRESVAPHVDKKKKK